MPHKRGLVEFLDFLEAKAIPKAVATSTVTASARDALSRAGVLSLFEIIVGGDAIQHGKPAPDIFLEAAAQLGAEPSDCVVLEDSEPGIRAACAAGMTPILIPDLREPTQEMRQLAHTVVPSLLEAIAVVESIAQSKA